MAKKVLPKGFVEDEPILLEVIEDGFTVGVPYVCSVSGEVKHRSKSCMGLGEVHFYIELLVKEIHALKEQVEVE